MTADYFVFIFLLKLKLLEVQFLQALRTTLV
jgi:hypothetical protein